jgi:hypothetical protein
MTGTELGTLTIADSGTISCVGEQVRIGNLVVSDMVETFQYSLILAKEEFHVLEDHSILATHSGVKLGAACAIEDGGCQESRTFVWTHSPTSSCALERIRTIEATTLEGMILDHRHRIALHPNKEKQVFPGCPRIEAQGTNYQQIWIAPYQPNVVWPDLAGEDLDLELVFSLGSEYQTMTSRLQARKLSNLVFQQACKELQQSREPVHVRNSTFLRTRGDAIDLFECQRKIGQVARAERCTNDIRLVDGLGFVDPVTRVLKGQSSARRCNPDYPLILEDVEGSYFKAEPVPEGVEDLRKGTIRNPTADRDAQLLSPTHYGSDSQLYSQAELTNWRLSIQEGSFRSDPLQMLSNQFCSGQQSCELPPGGIHTPFGLGVLLKHEMQVTSGSLDWQEKAREWLQSHTVVICIGTIALCTLQWTVILTTALRGVTKRGLNTECGCFRTRNRAQRVAQSEEEFGQLESLSCALKHEGNEFSRSNPSHYRNQLLQSLRRAKEGLEAKLEFGKSD